MSGPAGRRPGRTGRRGGDSGTREAILDAARARFAAHGYDRATIRGIAGDAGVDAALVHHFFGSKDQLFVAAMQVPVNPAEVLNAALAPGARDPDRSLGEHLLRTVLTIWEQRDVRAMFLGLLRSAVTSEQAAAMLREFVTEVILGRIAQAAGQPGGAPDPDAAYRAALVASQVVGLALTRYVLRLEPVAEASPDELAVALGPALDRYLTGDIRPT